MQPLVEPPKQRIPAAILYMERGITVYDIPFSGLPYIVVYDPALIEKVREIVRVALNTGKIPKNHWKYIQHNQQFVRTIEVFFE